MFWICIISLNIWRLLAEDNIRKYLPRVVVFSPWWFSRSRICLQCGRPEFNPCVGKIPWRRACQPTLVLLPGESPWIEEPDGLYSPWGCRVLDTTKNTYSHVITTAIKIQEFHCRLKFICAPLCWTPYPISASGNPLFVLCIHERFPEFFFLPFHLIQHIHRTEQKVLWNNFYPHYMESLCYIFYSVAFFEMLVAPSLTGWSWSAEHCFVESSLGF